MLATNAYTIERQPAEYRMALAKRCRRLRKSRRLSQLALAERTGVSLGSLKRFEREGKVSLENLALLADGLGRLGELDSLFVVDDDLARVEKLFDQQTEQA